MDIKKRRTQLGLSQFALAQLADVSRYNISLHESGYKNLSGVESNRIERALLKKEKENVNSTNKKDDQNKKKQSR